MGVGVEYEMLMSRPDPRDGAVGAPEVEVIDLRTCPSCGKVREGSAWCERCLYQFPPDRPTRRKRTFVRYEREVTYSLLKGNAIEYGIVGRVLATLPWVALIAVGVWAAIETSDTKMWVLHGVWTAVATFAGALAMRSVWRPARHVKVHTIVESI